MSLNYSCVLLLMHRSYDSRNFEAGPSYSSYGYDVQPSISPARHERSQSRMVLIEPRRTTTQTKIWLDQHYNSGTEQERGEKGPIRSRSSSETCEDKEVFDSQREEDDQSVPERGMPFIIRPIHTQTIVDNEENGRYGENGGRPWLRVEDQATEWLSLFYGEFISSSGWDILKSRPGGGSGPHSFLVHSRTLIPLGNLDIPILLHNPSLVMDLTSPL